jgi:predicted amidohydrolase YtcJ
MTTLHVTNAKIWTGDPARPFASTLTIEDGRVTAIDAPHAGEPILDCAGDFVTPGLIDAHMHLALGGETLSQTDLSHATSREEFEARLAADHRTLPPEQWLIANGWSEGAIGETPDQSWLQVCGDRPTVCWRMDLHAALRPCSTDSTCRMTRRSPKSAVASAVTPTADPAENWWNRRHGCI